MPKIKKKKGISPLKQEVNDRKWMHQYKELKAYKKKNGHIKVPLNGGDKQLAKWMDTQRTLYKKGKLPDERINLLQGIGFNWHAGKELHKNAEASWNEMFEQLMQFKDKHNHCNVSQHGKEKKLGIWVMNQRAVYNNNKKGRLSPEQIDLLNDIGFSWNPVEDKWNEMFDQLVEFKNIKGHCNFPQGYKANPQLATWANTQRLVYNKKKKGKLNIDQKDRLGGIGFKWELRKHVGWNERFEQLEEFTKENGHCRVPQKYPHLGKWVQHQRERYKKGKLSSEQIESMNGIGFEWVQIVGWDERFEQLKGYKKDHGDCNVPRNYKANPQLGKWVNDQRTSYKKGKLLPDRFNRLEGIGFEWVLSRGRRQAQKVSDDEDSVSDGEEKTGGSTLSAGDKRIMIPSLPPLPSVAEDESMLTDEYQAHNQQGDVGEVELANDGSSFHMDEEDDHQEDDGEENDDIDSPTNVSPATEQEGGRSSSVESQPDLKQKLDEAKAQIASLLQPDIVDLTNEDSTICEDNQKESAGTKSVEAAVYAVYKVKQEKLDEADKKIAAAEEKVAVAEKRAELAEKRASVAEEEKSGHCKICLQVKEDKHAIVACGHSLCFDCYWELKKLRCPFCNVPIEPVKKKLKRLY